MGALRSRWYPQFTNPPLTVAAATPLNLAGVATHVFSFNH